MRDIHHWHQTVTGHLDLITAGILDTIQADNPDSDPVLRRPTDDEIVSTRRGADRDGDYAEPPDAGIRTPGLVSDPTGSAALAWTNDVDQAVKALAVVVDEWAAVVAVSNTRPDGVTVTDPYGRRIDPPWFDPDKTVAPVAASHLTWRMVRWLHAAAASILDTARHADDVEWWDRNLSELAHVTQRLARRHGRNDRIVTITRCANPHGLTNHPTKRDEPVCAGCRRTCDDRYVYGCDRYMVGEGPRTRTCNPCQQRAYRDRQAALEEADA